MKSHEVRKSFVEFFAARGHRELPSAPLVPHGDPTLLFTNAGMVQFKDYFLGVEEPADRRAVTVQKCLRVSGKHNDLENVGPSARHHTFFEMLGNFSFGDYFKEEAILYGWDLVTGVWGLDPRHLWVSVYEEDDEAAELWRKISGLAAERIGRGSRKDNYWAMGDTGPRGPCSEIFVDRFPDQPEVSWAEGSESGRYLEIWNLVFMQFDRDDEGVELPLPNPSIDTGAGLERVAAVLQGVDSNYDTDLFQPILGATAELASKPYGAAEASDVSMRVIADHLRAVTFLLADGVIPGNEGRGYVLRRVLRRAERHGLLLGFEEPFLHRLLPIVGEVMGSAYPEILKVQAASQATVQAEEEKFLATLATGSRQVQEAIDDARDRGEAMLSGEAAFRLYDTFGLPLELLVEIAEEEQFTVDLEGFEHSLDEQRDRSRSAGGGDTPLAAVRELLRQEETPAPTEFVGYDEWDVDGARVQRLVSRLAEDLAIVDRAEAGHEAVVLLDRSPFYGEAGGQVGDEGTLEWEGGSARVTDTQKDGSGTIYHLVRVEEGALETGLLVHARVDAERRRTTQRNHTGTHLLHAALRRVLGEGVRQAGSLVAPDRLRFDFTFPRPMSAQEVEKVESLVNRWVLAAEDTTITADRKLEDALSAGAMALFGEKYGDRVRTVEVPPLELPGEEKLGSLELCGGCHVRNTGEIGPFVIVSERGIASGVRRIEALTGEGARAWFRGQAALLQEAAASAGTEPERLAVEISSLRTRKRELESELAQARMRLVSGVEATNAGQDVDGVRVLVREVPAAPGNELRNMADTLRSKLGSGVVVLGAADGERVSLVTAVSEDLLDRVHAGRLAQAVAAIVGGSGGGRGDFAQAGGRDVGKLATALESVPAAIRSQLSG